MIPCCSCLVSTNSTARIELEADLLAGFKAIRSDEMVLKSFKNINMFIVQKVFFHDIRLQ